MRWLSSVTRLGCLAMLAAAAGCSVAGAPTSPSAATIAQAAAKPSITNGKLFVANWSQSQDSITVYPARKNKLIATITQGISMPTPAVGPDGRLYVANEGNDTVTIYDPRTYQLVGTLIAKKLVGPNGLAFDSKGAVYALCAHGVTVFPNASQQGAYTLIGQARGIAVDSSDNLWVGEGVKVYGYRPGAKKHFVTITDGVDDAGPVAVDTMGNLYVANDRQHAKSIGSVTVYNTTTYDLEYTLAAAQGIEQPINVLAGDDGDLYVNNGNDVTVYPFGQDTLLKTISYGINRATDLGMDAKGNLYVSNVGTDDVTEYAPATTTLLRTITRGVQGPNALAFGV